MQLDQQISTFTKTLVVLIGSSRMDGFDVLYSSRVHTGSSIPASFGGHASFFHVGEEPW
jgi:hypothetical protein